MMALNFSTKKAAKEALVANGGTLDERHIIETSFFGSEYKDGSHGVVVSIAPDRIRSSYATITIRNGLIVAIK